MSHLATSHPIPIAMWDFSWLERRWPGAGYEDWSRALDELQERGYEAVRIDPYPHLCAGNPAREWEILPCWDQLCWGSPALTRIRLLPDLLTFISACAHRNIKVALSTWWRQDRENVRQGIRTPMDHASVWIRTLDLITAAGFLNQIFYVDFSDEWPIKPWTPFFQNPPPYGDADWDSPYSLKWMRTVVTQFREHFPNIPTCFSTTTKPTSYQYTDVSFMNFMEMHLWMAGGEFYREVGYRFEPFSPIGFESSIAKGETTYRADPERWHGILRQLVNEAAACARTASLPLVTTEGWAVIDYKDWPLLDWGWVKELCALAVEEALATGAWKALSTSNFCGPQFVGMWRDIRWHQSLTTKIKSANSPHLDT